MYSNRTHAHAPGAASAAPRLLLGVLRRQRWLVAACLALGVAAGLLLARRVTPTYRASATVLVGDGSADMLRQDGAAQPMENRIATEMELLRSGRLAEAVVDSLQLRLAVTRPANAVRSALFSRVHVPLGAEPGEYRFVRVDGGRFRVERAETGQALGTFAPGQPVPLPGAEVVLAPTAGKHASFGVEVVGRESAAGALASAIDVEQGGQANLLRVSYAGPDPVLVRDVPNAIAREFIHLRKELQSAEARSTAAFLRGRLDTIRAQLTASEDQLQGFREREGVIDLGVEASTQVSRQAQLEAERGQLQAEQQALGTLLAEARATERTPGDVSPYRKLVAFPTLLRQEAVSQMLTSLARVEDQRSELLTRRRPNDPEVLPLTNRVNELETQLASIVITYQRGLASQVAQIDGTLGQFRSSMDRIPGKEAQHGRLERNARSLAEVYGLLQTRLKEAEIAEAVQDPGVRVMDTARLPTRPQGSTRGLMLLGGGLFGLLLGIGLAFAREYRDGTVRSRDDVEGVAHLPVLGWIPRIQGLGEPNPRIAAPLRALGRVVGTGRNASAPVLREGPAILPAEGNGTGATPTADAYEWLHRNILFARPQADVKTVTVTSPLPGDGKTTTAAGLAVTLARRGLKVLLVDADLRRGTLGSLVQGQGQLGFSDLLAGTAPFHQVVRTREVGGGHVLHYLPTGALPPDSTRLLDSPRAAALMEWLRERFYLVVFDTPPINLFADAAVLAAQTDAVIVVARAGKTEYDALAHAAEQCRRGNLPVAGVVLNDVDPDRDRDYDGAYRWYEQAKSYYAQAS